MGLPDLHQASGEGSTKKDLAFFIAALAIFSFFVWLVFFSHRVYGEESGSRGIEITLSNVTDSHGVVERNLDGTYYVNDTVHISYQVHMPPPPKDVRLGVSASYNTQLAVVAAGGNNWWEFAATKGMAPGIYPITVTVNVINEDSGAVLLSGTKTFTYELVPFSPDFTYYVYPVLKDGHRFTYDDRTGVIVDYRGSLQNGTAHPDRRLLLVDSYRANATIIGQTYNNVTLPLLNAVMQQQLPNMTMPTGIEYVQIPDALKVSRSGDEKTFIYFDKAGTGQYYLTTTRDDGKISAQDLNHAAVVNMTATLSWPEKYYFNSRITYDQPTPAVHGTETLQLSILDNTPSRFNVTVFVPPLNVLSKKVQETTVYIPVKDYAYDKAVLDSKSLRIANMVAADMPDIKVGQSISMDANSTRTLTIQRQALAIPKWVYNFQTNSTSSADPTRDQVLEGMKFHTGYQESMGPVMIVATRQLDNGTLQSFSKIYDGYNFMQETEDDKLAMDLRQNVPMKGYKPPTMTYGYVEAPWSIDHLTYANNTQPIHASTCNGNTCSLTVAPGNTNVTKVTAYNEFGGSAIGYLPADVVDKESGFFYKGQIAMFVDTVIVAAVVAGGIIIARKAFRLMGRSSSMQS